MPQLDFSEGCLLLAEKITERWKAGHQHDIWRRNRHKACSCYTIPSNSARNRGCRCCSKTSAIALSLRSRSMPFRETDFDACFDLGTASQSNALPKHLPGYK